jgi:peptide/nickel transport system permease protein
VSVLDPRTELIGPTTSSAAVGSGFLHRLVRQPVAVVCIGYLLALVVIASVAPLLLHGVAGQFTGDLSNARSGPSANHLLGTDTLGRDVVERLLVGARVTLIGVAEALAVILVVGVPIGLTAGFFGGWIDRLAGWYVDLTFSIPTIVLVLVVLAVFPGSMSAAMITFGVLAASALTRVTRAATLGVREELFVVAAQTSGLSRWYIISRHVLPRIAGSIIVMSSLLAAVALVVQTGLAYLQLIVTAPAPSWGGMVADGLSVIALQPWLIIPPGIVIAVTILAFGLLGDAVRDAESARWSAAVHRKRRRGIRSKRDSAIGIRSQPSSLLAVRNLRVSFTTPHGSQRVVDDVSFEIAAGEILGIVGESGCGKSVTAMATLGLLPAAGTIERGSIALQGTDLAQLPEVALRRLRGREIGAISQEPMISLDPSFKVGSQLAEAVRRHTPLRGASARAEVVELLRRVGLPDPEPVARRYPHELSGGMAQRVCIARALAGKPKLLIADEPTTALDVTVQAEILALLDSLRESTGMSILLITHDWGVIADLCDRAIVMYAGEVVEQGTVTEIFRSPRHPYTRGLLSANPHVALDAEQPRDAAAAPLPTIPGVVPAPEDWPAGCRFQPRCFMARTECGAAPIPLLAAGAEHDSRCLFHAEVRTAVSATS